MRISKVAQKPIITEKSVAFAETNRYVFKVERKASKYAIAQAIAETFGVDVLEVNTMIMPGKKRRIRDPKKLKFTKTSSWKKAVVRIKEGQKIELFPEGGNN